MGYGLLCEREILGFLPLGRAGDCDGARVKPRIAVLSMGLVADRPGWLVEWSACRCEDC